MAADGAIAFCNIGPIRVGPEGNKDAPSTLITAGDQFDLIARIKYVMHGFCLKHREDLSIFAGCEAAARHPCCERRVVATERQLITERFECYGPSGETSATCGARASGFRASDR